MTHSKPERPPPDARGAAEICAQTLAQHSKSFALAGKLLATEARRDAAVLYTYCRMTDDAIDLCEPREQPAALAASLRTLEAVYEGNPQRDVRLQAFQELVVRHGLPREYPEELLAGMAMDTGSVQYETLDELLLYCHRVAGVVGLMMCHVLGVTDARALRNAAHLGIAMQLTNICRDVAEDWQRGRVYLPRSLLRSAGPAFPPSTSEPFPDSARTTIRTVTRALLLEANRFYRSGDAGIGALPVRAAFSVRAARLVYSAIGKQILRRGYDPLTMRAVVPRATKWFLVLRAALQTLIELPGRWLRSRPRAPLTSVARFPNDILPV